MTTDLTDIVHMLDKSDICHKPDFIRDNLASMGAGELGALTVEGDTHKRQRNIQS